MGPDLPFKTKISKLWSYARKRKDVLLSLYTFEKQKGGKKIKAREMRSSFPIFVYREKIKKMESNEEAVVARKE